MNRKVLGWNINQRSGLGKEIPEFVLQELLEQDADVVMFLYRDDYYQTEKKVKNPDLTELIVSKHRNGPVGTLYFNFKKETGRFQELNSDVKEV